MKEPIRVLQVVTIMNMGGIENFLMNLYRAVDRTKVQFDFLVHREERGAFDDEIEKLGGVIHRMQPLRPHKFLSYRSQLKAFFQKHPEYKIIHSHLNANSTLVLSVAKEMEVPIRIAHSHVDRAEGKNKVLKNILKQLLTLYSTHNFGCSLNAGKWLFGESKFTVINNAIDSSKFIYDYEKAKSVKEQLGLTNRLVFGHVGSFTKVKNHGFLIDVFEEIQKNIPNSSLLLAGEGELKEEIQKKVTDKNLEKKVHFLGVKKDVNDYLNAMDVFLFPSFFEGLGIVLVEAQCNGIPILMTETLPQEVEMTNLITRKSIKDSAESWAMEIDGILIKYKNNDRSKYVQDIISNNYDIQSNVQWFQDFYLNLV